MVYSCLVLAASAILSLASAHGPELKRAPFEAAGIQPNAEGFGAPLAENEALASFAPPSLVGEKNSTIPVLKDRSSELVDRQTCGTGAGYCASMFRSSFTLPASPPCRPFASLSLSEKDHLFTQTFPIHELTNPQTLENAAHPVIYAVLGAIASKQPTPAAQAIHATPVGTAAAQTALQKAPTAVTTDPTARRAIFA
jgi:hypothetical protein